MLIRILVVLILLVTMTTWSVVPASACSCIPPDPGPMLERSEAAFIGRVVSHVDPPLDGMIRSSADLVTYTFAVESVAKGDLAEFVQVLSPISGASCGFEGGIPNGDRAGILLQIGDDGNYTSGLCSTLDPGALASVSVLTTPVSVPDEQPIVPADEVSDDDSDSLVSRVVPAVAGGLVAIVLFMGFRFVARRRNAPKR
jgi:hypothetical protein